MNVKFTFEELTTLLTQIEAVLNSRPLVPLPSDDDGIEALTPGHFLIGQPLESIPDPSSSYGSLSILRCWDLVQALVRHFWKRWPSGNAINGIVDTETFVAATLILKLIIAAEFNPTFVKFQQIVEQYHVLGQIIAAKFGPR